jgi:hypothetical protein
VETDKGHHYFLARWRDLWNWDRDHIPAIGPTTTRFKCQQSNDSANKWRRARASGRDQSISEPRACNYVAAQRTERKGLSMGARAYTAASSASRPGASPAGACSAGPASPAAFHKWGSTTRRQWTTRAAKITIAPAAGISRGAAPHRQRFPILHAGERDAHDLHEA